MEKLIEKHLQRVPSEKNEALFLKSVSTMVSQKFHKFLQSGRNNTRLIELLFEYLQLNKGDLLQTLKSDDLVLLSDNSCVVVSNAAVMEDLNLPSDQKETDRKIILHCANILQRNHGVNVCVWSRSGYT